MAQIDYYTIFRWMREELHLENTELECYAVIYNLSRGDNWFNAGVKNIMDVLGKSEPCVINALKSLTQKELIVKVPVIVNNAKRHYYKAANTLDEETLNNLSNPTLNNLSNPTLNNLRSINKIKNKENKEKRLSNDNQKKVDSPFVEKPFVENPQVENRAQYNIYNENKKVIKEKKSLSNDKQKAPDELFEKFWESYSYKRGKDKAVKAWKRLTKKEKEEAIKCVPVYKEDCLKNDRNMKYPSTYLNGKTWEDDFSSDGNLGEKKKSCYEPNPNDSDELKRFKDWMREKHSEIEFTEVPLTLDGYKRLQKEYGRDEVCNQLDYIDANIGKFRQCDIEKSIIQYFERQ